MLLALTGTNPEDIERMARFFEERSFVRTEAKSVLDDPRDFHPRHLLIPPPLSTDEARALKDRHGAKLLFVGPGDASSELSAMADHRLQTVDEASLEELSSAVAKDMAAFERPGWDEYFMRIAEVVSQRGNCMKRRVAAVVVKDKQILATGYNGTPRGAVNCNEGGCPRCNSLSPAGKDLGECLCNHAEENAITQAAYHGTSLRGTTLYCTLSPCLHCTKLIINAGIVEVVFNAVYPMEERSLALFEQCGVAVRRYEPGK